MRTFLLFSLFTLLLATPAATAQGAGSAQVWNPLNPGHPCGIVREPVCWTWRFVCYETDNLTCKIAPSTSENPVGQAACNNEGVVILLTVIGHNKYCYGESCTNSGVIILVGPSSSCMGNGLAVVCAAEKCEVVPYILGQVESSPTSRDSPSASDVNSAALAAQYECWHPPGGIFWHCCVYDDQQWVVVCAPVPD